MGFAATVIPRRALLTGGSLALFLTLVHTAIDTVSSMLTALLPTIQIRFGLTESALALLVATLSFSSSVVQPLFGALSDRLGMRLVGALGIILNAVLLSLIGVAPSAAWLFVVLLVGGLGSAAFHPAATSMARAAGMQNRGLAVSLFGAGGTLGLALGPVLVLSVIATFGLQVTPWLMIPGVVLGVMTYVVVPPLEPVRRHDHGKLFDARLVVGPVGLLSLAGTLSSIAIVTFGSAMPLWLVSARGIAPDAALIGWMLAAFSLSAALGGITAGTLSNRVSARVIVPASMVLTTLPLFVVFSLEPDTPLFFVTVMLAGALSGASLPLLIVAAQDLAPGSMSAASGMLMGFANGAAGMLYIGVGRLQEVIGLAPAMRLSYLALVPAAILAFAVLSRQRPAPEAATHG